MTRAEARTRMINAYCETPYVTPFYARLDRMLGGHVAFAKVLAFWDEEARRRVRGALSFGGWPAARIGILHPRSS